jgi:PAS domain S-box-containing protein
MHQTQIGKTTSPLELPPSQLAPEPVPAADAWHLAFDALAEPMWVMDAECRIQECNRAAQELFGENIIGRHCWEVVHGAAGPVLDCPFPTVCQSLCRESGELSLASRWFNCTVDPLLGARGKIAGAVLVLREISAEVARRQEAAEALRHERQLLLTLMNLLPDLIFVKDKEGRFLLVNEPFANSYGRPAAQILGHTDADFMLPRIAARCQATEARVLAGKSVLACEDTMRFPDGQSRTMVTHMAPFHDARGAVAGLVGIGHDITQRKLVEQAARRSEWKLYRANRTLQVIRDCHEAMLRADTELALLERICQVIVRSGGRVAWVALLDQNSHKILRPVAFTGFDLELLTEADISWAAKLSGRGPVGTAIRTGKCCICRNTHIASEFAPWRRFASRYGFGSAIALPLKLQDQCLGALSICAAEPDAFNPADQLLFMDLADDLAFGLGTLRLRAERQRLVGELLKSAECEQERISRDLHDGVCQLLVGAKLRSGCLRKITERRLPAARAEANAIEKLLNQAIQQTRDLAHGLSPVKVTPAGLGAALQKLADTVGGIHGLRCVCRCPRPVRISDHHLACHLYRIAQEAVQNALKHARAKNIIITLVAIGRRLVLTVSDDGTGIRLVRGKRGAGLDNMHTRARLIGGRLKIQRRNRGGTAVSCELFRKLEKKT